MKKFFKDMAERAVKTFAQTFLATLGTSATLGEVNWKFVLPVAAIATICSVLTSLGSIKFGSTGTASLLNTEEE